MEASRAKWTDDRIDDLAGRVTHLEARMDARFDRMDARFDKLEARFDRLQLALVSTFGGLAAAVLAVVAASLL